MMLGGCGQYYIGETGTTFRTLSSQTANITSGTPFR